MTRILLCIFLAACSSPKHIGPFVRSVSVQADDLLLEMCTIKIDGEDIDSGDCHLEIRKLPMTARVPVSLTAAEISERLTPEIFAGIRTCGPKHGVINIITVQLEINYLGRIVTARVPSTPPDFADCVGAALQPARFPLTQRGARISLPIQMNP
jgi:hypothetical protein